MELIDFSLDRVPDFGEPGHLRAVLHVKPDFFAGCVVDHIVRGLDPEQLSSHRVGRRHHPRFHQVLDLFGRFTEGRCELLVFRREDYALAIPAHCEGLPWEGD